MDHTSVERNDDKKLEVKVTVEIEDVLEVFTAREMIWAMLDKHSVRDIIDCLEKGDVYSCMDEIEAEEAEEYRQMKAEDYFDSQREL